MSHYWATFTRRKGDYFRLDTRIYLKPCAAPQANDIATGCIVGKNPGSALGKRRSLRLQPIQLAGDKFLPTVLSVVRQSYAAADVALPEHSYVRVLNLFYLCDRELSAAKKSLIGHARPLACPTEHARDPWRWFAWGGADVFLDPLKLRFMSTPRSGDFYYDGRTKRVVPGVPASNVLAKHTQGMPQRPVIDHLTDLIASRAHAAPRSVVSGVRSP